MDSLPAIRSYLAHIALQQARVLSELSVDGQSVNGNLEASVPFQHVQAHTVSLVALSERLIGMAREQVEVLQARVEAAAMQVLINDWSAVEKLWRDWEPEFLAPVEIMNSVRELCGCRIEEILVDGHQLGPHLQQFDLLWKRLNDIFAEKDILELSNALEQILAPWLKQLSAFLDRLSEG